MTFAMGTVKRAANDDSVSSVTSSESAQLDHSDIDDGAERRQAQRLAVDMEVDYQSQDNYLFAYVADISATGIFIRTNAPHPPGTRLNLRFTPPRVSRSMVASMSIAMTKRETVAVMASNNNTRGEPLMVHDAAPIEIEGEVIWTNPLRPNNIDNTHPGMGVRFAALDPRTRQRLLDLIRRIAYLPEPTS
jgi:c-di-GMP-binding flagellar brake protein YcgR